MLENQNNKGLLQKTHWRSSGDLITADHKVLNEAGESRDTHRYAVVVQGLATQWIQSYPCKQNLHMRRRKVHQNSWSRRTDRKLSTQTTRWNFRKRLNVYHGITALQHLIVPRQMASLKEPFNE